jgi:hypothetical protein
MEGRQGDTRRLVSECAGELWRDALADARLLARLLQRRFEHLLRPPDTVLMSLI